MGGGLCHREKTYDEAEGICADYDSRLCTKDELSRGCTRGTGCSLDSQLIWSGTPVTSDPVSPSPSNAPTVSSPTDDSEYYVVCGRGTGCGDGIDEAVADVSELHEVRCCKDESAPGFKTRCEGVWAASEWGGLCHREKTYDEEEGICALYDSRLCTKDELSRECTRGSGCGLDGHLIWSGTPVTSDPVSPSPSNAPTVSSPIDDSEYYVVCGRGTGCSGDDEAVADVSESHPVRCCKDERTSVFKTNHCEGVYAASTLGGECHKEETYDEAEAICAEYGGRLCTKDELSGGCTRASGCGIDGKLIWSGTPVE